MLTSIMFTTASTISAGDDVDLPGWAPDIDEVVSASINRPASAVSIDDHADADIVAAIDDQSLDTQVAVDGAVTNALGHDATPELETGAAANVSIDGCISTHAGSGTDVSHTSSGADPTVAVTATKSDTDTVTLDVDFEQGDFLILNYIQVGTRLQVT